MAQEQRPDDFESFIHEQGNQAQEVVRQSGILSAWEMPHLLTNTDWARQQSHALATTVTAAVLPDNLKPLADSFDLDHFTHVLEDGLALTPAPRAEIVKALLEAPDVAERRKVLADRLDQILEDVQGALGALTHSEITAYRQYLADATAAAQDGHYNAAQALTASVLDSLIRIADPADRNTHIKRRRTRNGQSVDVPEHENLENERARQAWRIIPVRATYDQYKPDDGDPVPSIFNRHASAHSVGKDQYHPAALAQGLLTTLAALAYFDEGLMSGEWGDAAP